MKITLLTASAAALLALGMWSTSASATSIGSGLDGLRSDRLVQKADYDGDDWRNDHRRVWWWRHHHDDDDRGSWWRHHRRFDRDVIVAKKRGNPLGV